MKDMKIIKNQEKFSRQGERLKKCLEYARENQGDTIPKKDRMTQKKLADTLFIPQQYISDMINGRKGIPDKHIDKIAETLGVRREYLLLKSDYMTEKQRIHDITGQRSAAHTACYDLLSALGYTIQETMTTDNGLSSMHYPFAEITIRKKIDDFSRDDTDNEILEKAHAAIPTRYFVVTTPNGDKQQLTQKELNQVINDIQDYACFLIEKRTSAYIPKFINKKGSLS